MKITKSGKLLGLPIYPVLIAVAPVLSLYSLNIESLTPLDLIRPSLAHLVLALTAFVIAKSISASNLKAAILATILIISSIVYGHALKWTILTMGAEFSREWFLVLWIASTIGLFSLAAYMLRKLDKGITEITIILNVFALVVICSALAPMLLRGTPLISEIQQSESGTATTQTSGHEWFNGSKAPGNQGKLPDFYFIILDAYARSDVLKSRFDFNNSEMTEWLERQGFFVGHKSHSNYPWTHLSLSSTLNGEYLQTLIPDEIAHKQPQEQRRRYLYIKEILGSQYVNNSRVQRFFSGLGYRIISNDSGHSLTRARHASISQALVGGMNEFEEELLSRSVAQPVLQSYKSSKRLQALRLSNYGRIIGALDNLAKIAEHPGPKFVFYHLLSPHEPFCFGSDGSPVDRHPVYDASPWLTDKMAMPGYAEWKKKNYPRNVQGLNHHLKRALQQLLDATDGGAVIIVQSDHGSSLGIVPQSPEQTDMEERFGILNAIYLPPGFPREGLSDSLSSVNTFPVVLGNVFRLDIETLDDRAYYSNGDLQFFEVTEQVRQ